MVRAAASFMPVEMTSEPATRAPRKMPGKPSTLLTIAPSAANAAPAASAALGSISGSGLVRAMMTWPVADHLGVIRPGGRSWRRRSARAPSPRRRRDLDARRARPLDARPRWGRTRSRWAPASRMRLAMPNPARAQPELPDGRSPRARCPRARRRRRPRPGLRRRCRGRRRA